VVQAPEAQWTDALVPDFTYGALVRGPQRYGSGASLVRADAEAGVVRALMRRPSGAVLVGTARLAHLAELVRAAEQVES